MHAPICYIKYSTFNLFAYIFSAKPNSQMQNVKVKFYPNPLSDEAKYYILNKWHHKLVHVHSHDSTHHASMCCHLLKALSTQKQTMILLSCVLWYTMEKVTSGRVYAKGSFKNFPPLQETYDFCYILTYFENMQCPVPAGKLLLSYSACIPHISIKIITGDAQLKYSMFVNSTLPVSDHGN